MSGRTVGSLRAVVSGRTAGSLRGREVEREERFRERKRRTGDLIRHFGVKGLLPMGSKPYLRPCGRS